MSKRLYKIIGNILCAACLATLLTGCGKRTGNSGGSTPVVITVWHYYNGIQQTAFDEMVEEFNETVGKEQGIAVESYAQGSVENLVQGVLDAADKKVGASDMPNICSAYADTAYQMYRRGLTADLAPFLTEQERAGYVESFLKEGEFREGEITIFPIAKATETLVLNLTDWKPFAEAEGIDMEALSTYEGLTETARIYYEWTDAQTPEPDDGKAFFARDVLANLFYAGAKQFGFELLENKNGRTVLNCDAGLFHKIWDNFYVPYVKGSLGREGRFGSDDMKTGQVIAYIGSSSGAYYVPGEVNVDDNHSYPIETLVLPCPVFSGGGKVATQQGAGMVVLNTGQKEVEACAVFLKWFTREERNVGFAQEAGYMPVTSGTKTDEEIEQGISAITETINRNMAQVSVDMLHTYELYTPKAAQGAETVRSILENSLREAAETAKAAIAEAVEAGSSRADAEAPYLSEPAFEAWYGQITEELEAAVK